MKTAAARTCGSRCTSLTAPLTLVLSAQCINGPGSIWNTGFLPYGQEAHPRAATLQADDSGISRQKALDMEAVAQVLLTSLTRISDVFLEVQAHQSNTAPENGRAGRFRAAPAICGIRSSSSLACSMSCSNWNPNCCSISSSVLEDSEALSLTHQRELQPEDAFEC